MKVVGWFLPDQKKEARLGIQFYQPRKKLFTFFSSQDERKSWVSDIRKSIDREVERNLLGTRSPEDTSIETLGK
jgi:hypothetical protein